MPPAWLTALALALVAAICIAIIASQRHFGLNLMDEGFLWYGAQRVLHGELPLRDFQAYDPARYFWSAAWMAILGSDGIVALRLGNAVLAAITVCLATWVVRSEAARPTLAVTLAVGLVVTLWMVPDLKAADGFAAVLLIFGLTRLLRQPSFRRYGEFGVCLGVASTIGINHALYGSVAGLMAFASLRGSPDPVRSAGAVATGGVLGYAPMIALHLFAPGFSAAFFDGIRQLFEYGTTNLSHDLPSLLAIIRAPSDRPLPGLRETLSALAFLAAPILWGWTAWRLRSPSGPARISPAVLASLILSVPYAHYAYSRADDVHIGLSALPFLVAGAAWAVGSGATRPWLILALMLGVTAVMTAGMHPRVHFLRGGTAEAIDVSGERLFVRPAEAAGIRAAQAVARRAGAAEFFAGPYLPGAYALARRRSPVWEIYMLFPATAARQEAEIARLDAANVRYALLSDDRIDGRSDLGLAQTHPLVTAYLKRCLPMSDTISVAPGMTILTGAGTSCREHDHAR